jgi:hypothetical protein
MVSAPITREKLVKIANLYQENEGISGHLCLKDILEKTIEYENSNSKIFGMSRNLLNGQIKLISRQNGINIFFKENALTSI